ncbi:putative transcriptional regulator YdeE [Salirhabdus euzebyi]|uniref:Putative transcriptional regulator YdeE n=1 Tax=Salirhabdus euzebyi TaxID=394506 RepID=A0A841Q6M3_9BACI|nr:GyrI-like domain-containing protein [Salirhabdus euzebyi]MBB6454051.1 putative transcriptional regulator YdeE [Salirhabdus euzebyi]
MTKSQRLIELMVRVYEKQNFTVEELALEFDVSYRTMLRYLHELSGYGVPLYSNMGKNGGYSLLQTKTKQPFLGKKAVSVNKVIKPTTHVIGLEFKAPFTAFYMSKSFKPFLWKELHKRKTEIKNLLHKESYIGVSLSRSHIYHYIAGVEVTKPFPVPENMVTISLPTREYVVYNHFGSEEREDTDQTYFHMMEKLKKQGIKLNPKNYSLELFDAKNPNLLTIHLPLES